jgi:hypothetical protein
MHPSEIENMDIKHVLETQKKKAGSENPAFQHLFRQFNANPALLMP